MKVFHWLSGKTFPDFVHHLEGEQVPEGTMRGSLKDRKSCFLYDVIFKKMVVKIDVRNIELPIIYRQLKLLIEFWSVWDKIDSRSFSQSSDWSVFDSETFFPNCSGKKCSGCIPSGLPTTRNRVGVWPPLAATDSNNGSANAPPIPFKNARRSIFVYSAACPIFGLLNFEVRNKSTPLDSQEVT